MPKKIPDGSLGLNFDASAGSQPAAPVEPTKKQRNAYHRQLLRTLADIEAESNQAVEALAEIVRVSDPELGIPGPTAWARIRRKYWMLALPPEPYLSGEQQKRVINSGRLKRDKSHAINRRRSRLDDFIEDAYEGKIGPKRWASFRSRHPELELPTRPALTLEQYFEARRRLPKFVKPASFYSLIRWRRKAK